MPLTPWESTGKCCSPVCLRFLSLRERLSAKMHRALGALSVVAASADSISALWAEQQPQQGYGHSFLEITKPGNPSSGLIRIEQSHSRKRSPRKAELLPCGRLDSHSRISHLWVGWALWTSCILALPPVPAWDEPNRDNSLGQPLSAAI